MIRKTFLALFSFIYLIGLLWFSDTAETYDIIVVITLSACGFLASSYEIKKNLQLTIICTIGSLAALAIIITRFGYTFGVDYGGLFFDSVMLIILLSILIESNFNKNKHLTSSSSGTDNP